ncbi:MAG TPA: gamma-glutamyltransferase [Mycobacteriales bacterium]|nr:gamma-glutamyltransferase [Mycobacteriales bacterium]
MPNADLDPAGWPAEELALATEPLDLRDLQPALGESQRAMVLGSTGPFAQVAGRHVLEAGGSACDAAIATATTQIALASGAWVSYGGIFHLIHFDAATGEVSSLSAGFGTFRGETDAATIPPAGQPSGRTAMVPGFFAGVGAAHERFGRLPLAELLRPAIHVAETGTCVSESLAGAYKMRRDVLARTPEGCEIFLDADGNPPAEGTTLRQPQLADTLRAIARDGVSHVYTGPWAKRFVELVTRDGGKVTEADLASYAPIWAEPIRTTFNGYEVCGPGLPDTGGVQLAEGLNLLEEAGLDDWLTSPESLYWLIQIARQGMVNAVLPPMQRITREHARATWKEMQAAGRFVGPTVLGAGTHSDLVVAVDSDGNCAAVCHSINTSMFGTTGIFVDGISIPDAACFQQIPLSYVPPGSPLPHPMEPSIALRDGKPVLASSSIGAGLMAVTLQCVGSVLAGKSVADAVAQPLFHAPNLYSGDSINSAVEAAEVEPESDNAEGEAEEKNLLSEITAAAEAIQAAVVRHITNGVSPLDGMAAVINEVPEVVDDTFDAALLAEVAQRGQPTVAKSVDDASVPRGYWGGISIDPDTGALAGGRTPFVNGRVEGL